MYRITIPALQINIISLPVTMNRKIKKTISEIKFSAVTIKQRIKQSYDILPLDETHRDAVRGLSN